MKTVAVHVTDDDIRLGVKAHANQCPIALAIARMVGADVLVGVQPNEVSFASEAVCLSAKLPIDAERFVQSYDENDPVHPFDFPLELPDDFPLPMEAA